MADVPVPSIATAAPTPPPVRLLGTTSGGLVRNFLVSALAQAIEFAPAWVGAVARSILSKLSDTVSVKDFGAVGDGVTDDTAAFNALTAWMRAQVASNPDALNTAVGVRIPPGRYSVSSWDLTNLVGRQFTIEAAGAVLVGNTPDVAVVDQLNSRWVRIHDLVVFASAAVLPRCGIQNGPGQTGVTCGNNYYENCFVVGYFADAAYMNFGSETTQTVGCTFENRNQDPAAYSTVMDGACISWLPESVYQPVPRLNNTPVSFSHNSAFGTQFRNAGGGPAVYISGASCFQFDPSNYVLSLNDAGFVLYGGSVQRSLGLNLSPQYENTQNDAPTPGNTGIKWAIKFVGDQVSSALEMLTVDVGSIQCEEAVIYDARGGASALRLSGLRLRATQARGDGAPVLFKTDGASMTVDGHIDLALATQVNFGALASFSGTVLVDNLTTLPATPTVGAFVLMDRGGRMRAIGSTEHIIRNLAGTAAQVVIGNTGQASVAIQGSTTVPQIRAVGSNTDIDLQLAGQGAGLVRFGTHTANADAPVVGYVTIKDAAGTPRKLACIS